MKNLIFDLQVFAAAVNVTGDTVISGAAAVAVNVTVAGIKVEASDLTGKLTATIDTQRKNIPLDSAVTIIGGSGADAITNKAGGKAVLDGGKGKDVIMSSGEGATIDGGDDDDTITINTTTEKIYGMTQTRYGHKSYISGGGGSDKISVAAGTSGVTVDGGAGSNQIYLNNGENNVVIVNAADEGKNVITGFSESSTLRLTGFDSIAGSYLNGSDFVIKLTEATEDAAAVEVTLKGAAGSNIQYALGDSTSVSTIEAVQKDYYWTKGTGADADKAYYGNDAGAIATVSGLLADSSEDDLKANLTVTGNTVYVGAGVLDNNESVTVSGSGKIDGKNVALALADDVPKSEINLKQGWTLRKKSNTAVYHSSTTSNGYKLAGGKITYVGKQANASVTLTGVSSTMQESDFNYDNGTVTIAENALTTLDVNLISDYGGATVELANDVNQNTALTAAANSVYVFNGTAYLYAAKNSRPMAHTLTGGADADNTSLLYTSTKVIDHVDAKGKLTAKVEGLGVEEVDEQGIGYINTNSTAKGGVYFNKSTIIVTGEALGDNTIVETTGNTALTVLGGTLGSDLANTIKPAWDYTTGDSGGVAYYYGTHITKGWTVGKNSLKQNTLTPTEESGKDPVIVIDGLKDGVKSGLSVSGNKVTVGKDALDSTKTVEMTTGGDAYTFVLSTGKKDAVTASKSVEGGVSVSKTTATYMGESITAGYYVDGSSIKYTEGKTSDIVNIKGVKSGAKATAIAVKGYDIELSAAALGTTNVTIDNTDFSLSLADDVTESKLTAAHWTVSSGNAIYLSEAQTAGFSVGDEAQSLIYSKGTKASNLAEVKNLGAKATAADIKTDSINKVITISKNTSASTQVSVKTANAYSFVLGAAGTMANAGAAVTMTGSTGNDTISGVDNKKVVINDTILGGAGADLLSGFYGNDYIDGGEGNDILKGGEGNDTLLAGTDTLKTSTANTLEGGNGNDLLIGGAAADYMDGGAGNDTLKGGAGADKLHGEAGNDYIEGGAGADVITAGAGNDTVYGGDDNDNISSTAGVNYLYGGAGNDTITGGSDANTIDGGANDDKITGGAKNDFLNGADGKDTVYGGAGNDTVYGGAGNDVLSGDAGNDLIWGDTGANSMSGGAGDDTLLAWGGTDTLTGGDGKDVFVCSVLDTTNATVIGAYDSKTKKYATDFTSADVVGVDYADAITSVSSVASGSAINLTFHLKNTKLGDNGKTSTITLAMLNESDVVNVKDLTTSKNITLSYKDEDGKTVAPKVTTAAEWLKWSEWKTSSSSVADLWFDDENNFATGANIGDIVKSESPFIGEVESSGSLYDSIKKSQDEITVLANADK